MFLFRLHGLYGPFYGFSTFIGGIDEVDKPPVFQRTLRLWFEFMSSIACIVSEWLLRVVGTEKVFSLVFMNKVANRNNYTVRRVKQL